MIVAFGSVPKDAGTFTFYRTVRPKLLKYGIDIRCVSVGKNDARLYDGSYADDGCVLLAEEIIDIKGQAQTFAEWCDRVGIDVVVPINSVAILASLPHLSENIKVVSRCANSFDHGYRITVECYERLIRIVTTTPRQGKDLVNDFGVSSDRIELIPNGIDPSFFEQAIQKRRGENSILQLGYLGRLEHGQKGVLFLPEILKTLHHNGVVFHCKIAGKGVHGRALQRELDDLVRAGKVSFLGTLSPSEVPFFLGNLDVYLFPSQFEGCPNALLEAIMAGCVPVAWRLDGITDFIIKDGVTGHVCDLGDCDAFASKIAALAADRTTLKKMSIASASDARGRFSQSRVAADYARIFKEVMMGPPVACVPKSWDMFSLAPYLDQKSIRDIVPDQLKKAIRNILFYLHLSSRYEE